MGGGRAADADAVVCLLFCVWSGTGSGPVALSAGAEVPLCLSEGERTLPWPTLAKRPLLLPKGDWCPSCSCSATPPHPSFLAGPSLGPPTRAQEHRRQYQLCSPNPRRHLPEIPAPSSLNRKAGEHEWASAGSVRAVSTVSGPLRSLGEPRRPQGIRGRGHPQHRHSQSQGQLWPPSKTQTCTPKPISAGLGTCAPPRVKQPVGTCRAARGAQLGAWGSGLTWGAGRGSGREGQAGRAVCVILADSLCRRRAETSTAL